MADLKEENNAKKNKKEVYIPQSAQDVQRMKIEKLMSNPVGLLFHTLEDICADDLV